MSATVSAYVLHTLSCRLQSCKQLPSQARFLNRRRLPLPHRLAWHLHELGRSVGRRPRFPAPSSLRQPQGSSDFNPPRHTSRWHSVLLHSTHHVVSQPFGFRQPLGLAEPPEHKGCGRSQQNRRRTAAVTLAPRMLQPAERETWHCRVGQD